MCAVQGQGHQRHDSGNDGVPVQYPRLRPHAPIGPKRQKEITVFLQGNTAQHIAQRGAIKNRQQHTGEGKAAIEEPAPSRRIQMHA